MSTGLGRELRRAEHLTNERIFSEDLVRARQFYLGVSLGLPLFLYQRQAQLDRAAG